MEDKSTLPWAIELETRCTAHVIILAMNEDELLDRISIDPRIFGGKPIIRGRRLAVEHVLGMLAAGDSTETILAGYSWLEPDDIRACLVCARRILAHERFAPVELKTAS